MIICVFIQGSVKMHHTSTAKQYHCPCSHKIQSLFNMSALPALLNMAAVKLEVVLPGTVVAGQGRFPLTA